MTPASPFRLDGKVALVTGAGRGIGAAIAHALAAAGAAVAVNDADGARAASVAAALGETGADAVALQADIGDEAAVDAMFTALGRRHDRLDILVCNAGIARAETIFETTLASWNEVLRVNLTGAFLCCRRGLESMRSRGAGRILLLGSVTGHQGALMGHLHYATTKAGLHGFAKTLARTAAPFGVTVNAIAPGIVDTEMLRRTHGDDGLAELARLVPVGLGAPDDVAAAAVWLASDAARHVTGAVIDVNGGMYMR